MCKRYGTISRDEGREGQTRNSPVDFTLLLGQVLAVGNQTGLREVTDEMTQYSSPVRIQLVKLSVASRLEEHDRPSDARRCVSRDVIDWVKGSRVAHDKGNHQQAEPDASPHGLQYPATMMQSALVSVFLDP